MAENNFTQNAATDIVIDALLGVTDPAAVATDILLDQLIDALVSHYALAATDIEKKTENYFSKFKELDQKKAAEVKAGKLSKEDYGKWRAQKMLVGDNYKKLQETLTSDMVHADQIAADIINNKKCDVYALNHNFGAYEIEHSLGTDISYVLYDHNTVERLIAENPKILPKVKIDPKKDIPWNKQKINNAITQGVLQGESIPEISKRLREVTDMDKNAAIRNARTAVTGAQNAGRTDSYKRAEQMGIDIEQIWISTLDGRTRHSHRLLMGERRPVGKKFSNGLMFPGDPDGVGAEVYNCRCTLIADVDGTGYDLAGVINENLSKKDMTFDEWVSERPLPRHYKETKKQYLERYSEYKKKQSFGDWLQDQAAPDSTIENLWGDKKYGFVYNLIKNSALPGHGADANNFFNALKDLGEKSGIGNPPKVWNAYMTGQLDAEDFKKFEDIIKKYVPQVEVTPVTTVLDEHAKFLKYWQDKSLFSADVPFDAVHEIDTKYLAAGYLNAGQYWQKYVNGELIDPELDKLLGYKGKIITSDKIDVISDAAVQAESQLKITKGAPMTKEGADTHKVNPLYEKDNFGTTHNCQTATFAYECRRQGYDVVALPKMTDKNGKVLAEYGDIGTKQIKLGNSQAEGWINKQTGLAPESLCTFGMKPSVNEIEKIIGTSGERYSFSVAWKKGGAHSLSIERDTNGIVHIIDNQRGFGEVDTWTLEEYLSKNGDKIDFVKSIYRLDDCVPNPEYFNSIVVDASKMKKDLAAKVTSLSNSEYTKINKLAKTHGETASTYYTKYKYGIIDDPELDNLFVKNVPEWVKDKDFDLVSAKTGEVLNKAEELKKIKNMNATDVDDLITQLQNEYFGLSNESAKKIIKQSGFNLPETAVNKVDEALEAFKKTLPDKFTAIDKNIYNAAGDVLIKYKGGFSVNEYWDDYLKGNIKNPELDDILKKFIPETKVDDTISTLKDSLKNKSLGDLLNENKPLWQDIQHELAAMAQSNKIGSYLAYWNHYTAGEVDNLALDNILKKHLNPYKEKDLLEIMADPKLQPGQPALEHILNDIGGNYIDYVKNWAKGDIKDEVLDELLLGIKKPAEKIDDTLNIFKKTLPAYLEDLENDLFKEVDSVISTNGMVWKKYIAGEIENSELDAVLKKYIESKATTQAIKKSDNIVEIAKTEISKIKASGASTYYDIYSELEKINVDLANELDTEIIHLMGEKHFINKHKTLNVYLDGDLKSSKLDEIFTEFYGDKLSVASAAEPVLDVSAFNKKSASAVWKELNQAKAGGGKFWSDITKISNDYNVKPAEAWKKYLAGELSADDAKIIESHLMKIYSKGGAIDYSKFGGKEIYDILKNYDSVDDFLFNVPSAEYDKIVKLFHGNADEVQAAIDEIKKLEKANATTKAAKTAKTAENSEELIKAQEKLKKAQDELAEIKKEIDQIPNKTYTGIWKNDVTLADYESKQSTLAAKKQYYYDEIESLEHCIEDPESWQFKKYGGEEGLNKKIAEYEKYIDNLSEFEIKGKEYLDEKTKIDKKIKKAEKAVTDAQDEVRQLTPVGEAFTQERKDAAVWAKNKTDEYKKVDKYYETVASKVHGSKTSIEHEGYYHYTWGSGPFNEPLYMFKNIDANGYGSKIRGLTSLIEKSSYDKDIWIQSAQNHITIEAFLGIKPGTLSKMTVEEAQQFVGVQNEIPQFLSGAVNKYGGSYNPGNMTVNIYCPAGSEVLYVREDGHFGKNEHEMILQRGGTYKLTKIYKGNGTHGTTEWIVDLELHPEVGYNKVQQ